MKASFYQGAPRIEPEIPVPEHPQVAIIDGLHGPKVFDIDGDGIMDLDHYETMGLLVSAQCPESEISPYLNDLTVTGMGQAFQDLHTDIQQGKTFDAVIFSVGVPDEIALYTDGAGNPLSAESLASNTDDIRVQSQNWLLDFFIGNQRETRLQATREHFPTLEAVNRQVPVYIAGGNSGPDQFNLWNLSSGPIDVGACNENGDYDYYSAKNSLISVCDQGIFEVNRVENGFDINGDGIADVDKDDPRLSGQTAIVDRFGGLPAQSVVASPAELQALKSALGLDLNIAMERLENGFLSPEALITVNNRLIPTSILAEWGLVSDNAVTFGEFVFLSGTSFHGGFRTDAQGNVYYDPAGDGMPDPGNTPVSMMFGTSGVAPAMVGRQLATASS